MASPSSEMQSIPMDNNCTIKARILDPDNNPSKPLLLTCHGAPGISNYKEPLASSFRFSNTFRILLSDLRGCGESDYKPLYMHGRWVQDVEALRIWAGGNNERIVWIGGWGTSHGGFLGLEYVLAYPERVAAPCIGDAAVQLCGWGVLNAFKTAMTDPRTKDSVNPEQLVRLFSGTVTDMKGFLSAFASIAPLYSTPAEYKSQ